MPSWLEDTNRGLWLETRGVWRGERREERGVWREAKIFLRAGRGGGDKGLRLQGFGWGSLAGREIGVLVLVLRGSEG